MSSHPTNFEFYLHFLPLAPHIGAAVGAKGKRLKKVQNF